MSRIHQISHHKTSVLHTGTLLTVRKNNHNRRCSIKRITLSPHHIRIHPGKLRNKLRILSYDHKRFLLSHSARCILSCLQNLIQHICRNQILLITTHTSSLQKVLHCFIHDSCPLLSVSAVIFSYIIPRTTLKNTNYFSQKRVVSPPQLNLAPHPKLVYNRKQTTTR